MQIIQNIDISILLFINKYLHTASLDKVMVFITFLGNLGLIWILLSAVLFLNKKYRKVGILAICALLLSNILGEYILKNIFQRVRPCNYLTSINMLIPRPSTYSFPSGHTAGAFAVFGIIFKEIKSIRIYILVLATLIAFSRMYLLVHYPTDIIGGIFLGIASSYMVLSTCDLVKNYNDNKEKLEI